MSAWAQSKQRELVEQGYGPPDLLMTWAEEAGNQMARAALGHVTAMDHSSYVDMIQLLRNHVGALHLDLRYGFFGNVVVAQVDRGEQVPPRLRMACSDTQRPVDGTPALTCRWLYDKGDWQAERWVAYYWSDCLNRWVEAARMER